MFPKFIDPWTLTAATNGGGIRFLVFQMLSMCVASTLLPSLFVRWIFIFVLAIELAQCLRVDIFGQIMFGWCFIVPIFKTETRVLRFKLIIGQIHGIHCSVLGSDTLIHLFQSFVSRKVSLWTSFTLIYFHLRLCAMILIHISFLIVFWFLEWGNEKNKNGVHHHNTCILYNIACTAISFWSPIFWAMLWFPSQNSRHT